MKQIKIQEGDKYKFAEIAQTVDQPFLESTILSLRDEFNIKTSVPYDQYQNFLDSLLSGSKDTYQEINKRYEIATEPIKKAYLAGENADMKPLQQLMIQALASSTRLLKFEMKIVSIQLEQNFDVIGLEEVIKKAIVCGEVKLNDLKYAPTQRINPNGIPIIRKMYWLRRRSESKIKYSAIADIFSDNSNKTYTEDLVRKNIDSYSNRLNRFRNKRKVNFPV